MALRSQALGPQVVLTSSALGHVSLRLQRGLDLMHRVGLEELSEALRGEPDHTGSKYSEKGAKGRTMGTPSHQCRSQQQVFKK